MKKGSFFLFNIGIIVMLALIFGSLVLNIVSIATTAWTEPWHDKSLWSWCGISGVYRYPCFNTNPPALIATGTAFNCLSFLIIVATQASHLVPSFRKKLSAIFILLAEVTTMLSLIFSTIGWYFIFHGSYQNLPQPQNINVALTSETVLSFRVGWSFWLMTPSFFLSILAAIVGGSLLGCKCAARWARSQFVEPTVPHTVYVSPVPRMSSETTTF